MIPLIWMLTWLPQVLLAMNELPPPANVNLTSNHFRHMLRWEPGPGTPTGVYYRVSVSTERGSWEQVSGCEHIQHPLVCNLMQAFSDPREVYLTQVTALMDGRIPQSVIRRGFKPIKDTELDLPLLTVTPCGRNLCVDLHPPLEHLRDMYESLRYKLRIKYNNVDREQDTQFLRREILENLAPGRRYCVSVCFSDNLVPRKSNYSQPVCALTPANYNTDALISVLLCVLVLVGLVILALLVAAGYICLRRKTLPLVLTSIHHIEGALVVSPCSASLSSLLNVEGTPPSSGEKGSSQTLSDESDEESVTETTAGGGGGGGGGYTQRAGTNLLSSSSSSSLSSSSLSAPSSPKPQHAPSSSSNQTSDVVGVQPAAAVTAAETRSSSSGLKTDSQSEPESDQSASPPPTDTLTAGRIQEEEVADEGSQDVNLLTLTFGREEEEDEEEEAHDESSSASVLPAQTWKTQEAALETVSCSVKEEEEEEEDSGYMGRPSTRLLQNLL